MQVNSVSNGQSFSGVQRIVGKQLPNGRKMISFVSEKGKWLGRRITEANGDIKGWRIFNGGERIDYKTISFSDKTGNPKAVAYTYSSPDGKGSFVRKWFIFDLDKFKENVDGITSLKGIKKYMRILCA